MEISNTLFRSAKRSPTTVSSACFDMIVNVSVLCISDQAVAANCNTQCAPLRAQPSGALSTGHSFLQKSYGIASESCFSYPRQNVTTYCQKVANIMANVATRAHFKQHIAKCKELWPFCENPVCPEPVWKPVTYLEAGDREPLFPAG